MSTCTSFAVAGKQKHTQPNSEPAVNQPKEKQLKVTGITYNVVTWKYIKIFLLLL